MNAIPKFIMEETRNLLGARGFMRLLNDLPHQRKLQRIADLAASGKLDRAAVEDAFTEARKERGGLDEVLDLMASPRQREARKPGRRKTGTGVAPLERSASMPTRGTVAPGVAPREASAVAPRKKVAPAPVAGARATSAGESERVKALEARLSHLAETVAENRRHGKELETLARALLERAVLDAVRIQALEAVIFAMADGSGIGADARAVQDEAVRQFLRRRLRLAA